MQSIIAVIKQTILYLCRNSSFPYVAIATLLATGITVSMVSAGADSTQDRAILESCQVALGYAGMILITGATLGALWNSCFSLSGDIDSYKIHLTTVKPCSFKTLWFGKMLGIFFAYAVVLLSGYSLIYGLFAYRCHNLPESAQILLKQELLCGRRIHLPVQPDLTKLAEESYLQKSANNEISRNIPKYEAIDLLKRQFSNITIEPQKIHQWEFNNLPKTTDENSQAILNNKLSGQYHSLKMKLYKNEIESNRTRNQVNLIWQFYRDYVNPESGKEQIIALPPIEQSFMTGTYAELQVPIEMVDTNGILYFRIFNASENDRLILIRNDSPKIYTQQLTFFNNYVRSFLQALIYLLFVASLGTTLSACFSSPVAAFCGGCYLFVSFMISGIFVLDNELASETTFSLFVSAIRLLCVTLKDANAFDSLIHGTEIPLSQLFTSLFAHIVCRGGLLMLLGIYVLSRREYAGQIKR